MKNYVRTLLGITLLAAAGTLLPAQTATAQHIGQLTGDDHVHHMLPPSKAGARTFEAFNTPTGGGPVVGALTYHGGPVMTTAVTYAIFWTPPTLQNGAATSLSAAYENIVANFLSLYPGHSIANNNTQYYSTSGSGLLHFTNYITNTGSYGGSYTDTSAYPASACSDPYTPGNCLSDAQIQAEVSKVMAIEGWTGGLNHIFFVYTGSGEGSCSSSGCAYTNYCAYHGYFTSGSTTVLYGNMPYSAAPYCQAGTAPNGDLAGDNAASITSHELTEAITDPQLNAWYSATGAEIGDLCAWNYGTNTWDSGLANESWPVSLSSIYLIGHPPVYNFELQMEYDNHTASCVQVGP